MRIFKNVIEEIMKMPLAPPESGGIIGGRNKTVCEFQFDKGLTGVNSDCYMPDVNKLNAVIRAWSDVGIKFYGLVHTHRNGNGELSNGDIRYIDEIMKKCSSSMLYFPVVISGQTISCYRAVNRAANIRIEKSELHIIGGNL